jgi:2-C-methyl-D-erythritol 4-phosphate cytidylyltransferase
MSRIAAILLAGGRGRRMRGAVPDKVLAPLAGRPAFSHSVASFEASGVAGLYVVVCRDRRQLRALAGLAPEPSILVRGGRERQDSVAAGLAALPADVTHVMIHDCARPLVRPGQLRALRGRLLRGGTAVLARRATDTIREERGGRLRTLERDRLWAMETPQAFERRLISRAYARVAALGRKVTDDAAAVELLGVRVALVENPHPNPKLTTAADLAFAEFLLSGAKP